MAVARSPRRARGDPGRAARSGSWCGGDRRRGRRQDHPDPDGHGFPCHTGALGCLHGVLAEHPAGRLRPVGEPGQRPGPHRDAGLSPRGTLRRRGSHRWRRRCAPARPTVGDDAAPHRPGRGRAHRGDRAQRRARPGCGDDTVEGRLSAPPGTSGAEQAAKHRPDRIRIGRHPGGTQRRRTVGGLRRQPAISALHRRRGAGGRPAKPRERGVAAARRRGRALRAGRATRSPDRRRRRPCRRSAAPAGAVRTLGRRHPHRVGR